MQVVSLGEEVKQLKAADAAAHQRAQELSNRHAELARVNSLLRDKLAFALVLLQRCQHDAVASRGRYKVASPPPLVKEDYDSLATSCRALDVEVPPAAATEDATGSRSGRTRSSSPSRWDLHGRAIREQVRRQQPQLSGRALCLPHSSACDVSVQVCLCIVWVLSLMQSHICRVAHASHQLRPVLSPAARRQGKESLIGKMHLRLPVGQIVLDPGQRQSRRWIRHHTCPFHRPPAQQRRRQLQLQPHRP